MRSSAKILGPVALALALATTLNVAAPAPAGAEARAEPFKVMLTVPKAARARAGGFDWLAKRRPAGAQVVLASAGRALPREIGRGSWICSPAGFGQKSRCHAN